MVQNVLQTKAAKFRKFDKKIEFSNVVLKRDEYPIGLEDRFNYFIVGSDQVWNPHYDFVAGKCDFLTFARNYQKISYAASFGVNEIPYERKFEFAEYLKNFKAISVREKQGARIVEELVKRNAAVVLDPTLLLNENEWKQVEKKPVCCPKKEYVFVYKANIILNGNQTLCSFTRLQPGNRQVSDDLLLSACTGLLRLCAASDGSINRIKIIYVLAPRCQCLS